MTTYQLRLHPYSYPFVTPFNTANGLYNQRTGFYISLKIASITAYSECAPLVGFSLETYEQCINLLQSRAPEFVQQFSTEPDDFYAWLHHTIDYASLRFALSVLYEDVYAQKNGLNFGERIRLNSPNRTAEIPLNAVFGQLPTQELIDQGMEKLALGFTCIKLKASELAIPSLITIMQIWLERYPNAKFRLDANGSWNPERCIQVLNNLASYNLPIEYVEQPIFPIAVNKIEALNRASPIPIAADEMLANAAVTDELIRSKAVDFLVIKPPIIGSIPEIIALIDKASEHNMLVVVTTLLDSGLNRHVHALLANYSLHKKPHYSLSHGLSTGAMLLQDLCKSPLVSNDTKWKITPIQSMGSLFNLSQIPKIQFEYSSNG